MASPDPESFSWARVALAFTVVFGLIGLFGLALKYITLKGLRFPGMIKPGTRRLELIETLTLDVRRRLVVVRCDEREHLLLLGHNQDIVVEANLTKAPTLETKSHL